MGYGQGCPGRARHRGPLDQSAGALDGSWRASAPPRAAVVPLPAHGAHPTHGYGLYWSNPPVLPGCP
eukprot:7468512-Heterocapsa_arctica.AAC.1